MEKRVRPKNIKEVNFANIVHKVFGGIKTIKWSPELATILSETPIDGMLFKFRYHRNDYNRILVVCPECDGDKQKLYKVKNKYACSICHNLQSASRRKPRRKSLIWTRYLRPLKKLDEIMAALGKEDIPLGRRQRLENKAQKLLAVIPESILAMRSRLEEEKKSE